MRALALFALALAMLGCAEFRGAGKETKATAKDAGHAIRDAAVDVGHESRKAAKKLGQATEEAVHEVHEDIKK